MFICCCEVGRADIEITDYRSMINRLNILTVGVLSNFARSYNNSKTNERKELEDSCLESLNILRRDQSKFED